MAEAGRKLAESRAARHLAVMRNLRRIKVRRLLVFNPAAGDATHRHRSLPARLLLLLCRPLAALFPSRFSAVHTSTSTKTFKSHWEPPLPLRRCWEAACAFFTLFTAAFMPIAPALLARDDASLGFFLPVDCCLNVFFFADWLLRAFAFPFMQARRFTSPTVCQYHTLQVTCYLLNSRMGHMLCRSHVV